MAPTPTDQEIIIDALQMHPDCKFGVVRNGMTAFFQLTRVVLCYRNEECYLNEDPAKYEVEGYPA